MAEGEVKVKITADSKEADRAVDGFESKVKGMVGNVAKAAAATVQEAYGAGALMQRDDLVAVYMPTAERVQVYQHEAKKMTAVFALTLRERDARVKQVFWMGNEFLAVREREGDTELLHFDVADWSAPKHLRDLTQSGGLMPLASMPTVRAFSKALSLPK